MIDVVIGMNPDDANMLVCLSLTLAAQLSLASPRKPPIPECGTWFRRGLVSLCLEREGKTGADFVHGVRVLNCV